MNLRNKFCSQEILNPLQKEFSQLLNDWVSKKYIDQLKIWVLTAVTTLAPMTILTRGGPGSLQFYLPSLNLNKAYLGLIFLHLASLFSQGLWG